jgi:hypothetical protein
MSDLGSKLRPVIERLLEPGEEFEALAQFLGA